MIKGRTFVYFFNFIGNSTLLGRWHTQVIASVLLIIAMVFMYPQVYHSDTLPVFSEQEVFIGREGEVQLLTDWIENSTVSIISIVGSPGFGKSTLAIRVGHEITEKGGIAVHYVDLYEVQDMTTLNGKLTFLVLGKRRSSEYLFMWASKLKVTTLFIFDNCDELLHKHKDPFQNLMKNLVRRSQLLKVVLTAKQMTSFLGSFKNFTLTELSTEFAASVLQKLSNKINRTMALEIARLVGNVPLALQVVGSLLKDVDPSTIANDLRRDPIPALSPELLSSTERVFTSLNISHHYLSPEHQKCGRLLANFPGSFDEPAVQSILGRKLVQDPSNCLRELQYKSLLSYESLTQRYRYHQLIKEFFAYISDEDSELSETFLSNFLDYYKRLGVIETYESLREVFHLLDKERSNFDFLFTQGLEIDPSNTHRDHLESTALIVFNSTIAALDMLHICKSLHSRDPLFRTLARLQLMNPKLYIDSAKQVVDTRESQQGILQDPQHPLFNLATMVLWQSEDVATFHLHLLKGDIHGATIVGIHVGQQGLFELDSEFAGLSMYLGLSAYLEMYVKLLVQLSKLEAIVHDTQNAIESLLMRYHRVAELFSFAPPNDLETQWIRIKYHSALAHNYILLGQFDHFLEQWKEILQLKWSPTRCKQVGCTSIHMALAHFGQGDYEQSAKRMEALLHSKSLQSNGRVRLFILLHASYKRLGNVERAAQLLTKDHYLSRFPSIRTIKATDYVNNSTNLFIVYHRCQRHHSIAWLLNRECMTISSQNYRTCFILAAFYRSLGSRDARKLGRVLHQVVRHHIERRRRLLFTMRWRDYQVYSGEASSPVYDTHSGSNFGGLLIMIALLTGILCIALFGCTVILRL